MKRSSAPITFRVGHREIVKVNATKYDWRDIYHLILTFSWPQFAGLVLGMYVLIILCFATLYVLGGRCIAELPPGSFSDAFFFSVETLATVGYGHAYPDTLYGHCVTTLEIMVGLSMPRYNFRIESILPCDANDLSLKHGETLIVRHFRTCCNEPIFAFEIYK